eukprot:gene10359-biopygen8500
MSKQVVISERKKAYVYLLRQESKLSYREIARRCKISKSSVERICKEGLDEKVPKKRSGRPEILSRRDKDRFLRKFKTMRESNPNVHVMDVAKECEITEVSKKTLCQVFTNSGYQYIRPRRKGLLTLKDKKKRVAYALKALKDTSPAFWTDDVLLYLDAVSFVHKSNPYEDALSPAGRVWRKPGEGLEITAKGSKDLPGGRVCHYVVGICHGAGAVLVEEYSTMNGSARKCNLESMPLERIISETSKLPNLLLFCVASKPQADVLLRFFIAGRVFGAPFKVLLYFRPALKLVQQDTHVEMDTTVLMIFHAASPL